VLESAQHVVKESVDPNSNRMELFLEIDRSAALFLIEEAEWELKDLAMEMLWKEFYLTNYCSQVALSPLSP
jgi:hypothetical protein